MEIYELFVLFILCVSATALPPSQAKQYRTDYVYNKKTDAFYKLHIEVKSSWVIQNICEVEGAKPMVPATRFDIVQLNSMFKRFPDLGNYVWVGDDGMSHESAEEQPIIDLTPPIEQNSGSARTWSDKCDVVTRNGEIENYPCFRELPFICKVDAKDAPYDSLCEVYGRDYIYVASVGSCYKIPRIPYSWNEAYAECQAEGAHLVVINSEAEMLAVKHIINAGSVVFGSFNPVYTIAGFRTEHTEENKPRVFKTIFNETLEQAGYNEWSPHEPSYWNGIEDCGSLSKYDGKFNDIPCNIRYTFVCEKEVHL